MEILSVPTEVCTLYPESTLGKIYLDWIPQPGDEMIRCAVNPNGPCQGCRFWEA